MRLVRFLALGSLLILVAACSSTGATAGWTYAPASSAPAASGSASVAPSGSAPASASASAPASASASASAPASAPATSEPSASASGGGAGATVTITAQNITFTTPAVTVAAGQAFTLAFDNEDPGVPHDVIIQDGSGAEVAKTPIFPGVATQTVQVPALAAGSYPFHCSVHSNMTGTLTVQ